MLTPAVHLPERALFQQKIAATLMDALNSACKTTQEIYGKYKTSN